MMMGRREGMLEEFMRVMLESERPLNLTPMMQSDHLTGGPFAKLIERIMMMRSHGMLYNEVIRKLSDDDMLQCDDIMNAVAGARVREEMGDEW